jgi:cysteinyl-tRNA synthetase
MSKSLKNFISIQECLVNHSASHIRILFLMHAWESTLCYDEGTLKEAKDFEQRISVWVFMLTA